ncbi:MAG TPA: serine/threonine-protein kinase [Polyangiaceae bacterium]
MATCPTCRAHFGDDVAQCPTDDEPLLPDEAFSSADADLPAGAMVGEYRVEAKLGEGGFGAVYRAVHPLIGKTAAVKVLSRQWSSNPQMVSRFIAEARAVNQIRHKNIIDIFAFGALPDGRQYYVMELLDGEPFDVFLHGKGRLAPETALPILRAVARALDAAHAQGIVHRDLKPENVYLVFEEDGLVRPKLLDFGIAKLLGEAMSGHKTRTGAPLGTPSYMSPEQCHGQPVDQRTDVYSLGVMAHQVLTGRLPFDAESVMSILVKHMSAPPPRMSEHCPELPAELDAPVLSMLAKQASERPASAGAAIEALVEAASRAGITVAAVASAKAPALAVVPSSSGQPAPDSHAQTVASADGAGRTFMPAERDVPHRPRGRTLIVALVAVVGVAGGVAVVQLMRPRGDDAAPRANATSAAPPTAVATSATASAGVAPSVALVPAEVAVTVESNAPHSTVWLAGQRLGDAPGPLKLPRGAARVTLTVKADGYTPSTVDVSPTEDVVVAVTLARPAAGPPVGSSAGKRVSKDLENPF